MDFFIKLVSIFSPFAETLINKKTFVFLITKSGGSYDK